jgi:hypothetical protein
MTACGRKRTLDSALFSVSERPLWRKADIPEYPQDFHKIDQLGTSAFHAKAAIRLESVKRSANDPKRTSPESVFRRIQCTIDGQNKHPKLGKQLESGHS